jgi:hypothetical protein
MKTITVTNIRGKQVTRNGVVHTAPVAYHHNAEIVTGKTIRLYGTDTNHVDGDKPYDRTFKVGDTVAVGSYNFTYLGKIVGISEKTVTVQEELGGKQTRLDLYTFDRRNYDLNLVEIARRNADTATAI